MLNSLMVGMEEAEAEAGARGPGAWGPGTPGSEPRPRLR